MKSIHLVLALMIGIFALSILPVNLACGKDVETAFKPFLGKWEGEWSFASGSASWGGRPCKLAVYLENGQGYVDYYVGPPRGGPQGKYHGDSATQGSSSQQNKLKAEVKDIKGSPCLVFTSKASNEYHWSLKDGKLLGTPSTASQGDNKCTLSKVK